ncbi:prepilin-type N-terminal cleavage/methylation domain-containing protein [uncultured Tateyamaria sp.]|uniref:pilus assembly FimT family protein n=1 Tax=Tateyamaria sp. 1078 TaxID=3417464 RepID=UPI00261C4491|nr:prepilin-type N-terminal cleavage/methylation domain-containing protein [uncultured Tateyamaria sp.]
MISPFDPSGRRAGVTLFETMVSLAILSLILAVAATAVRPPSPRLQAEATLSELVRQAQEVRLRAIASGTTAVFDTDTLCDDAAKVRFYPDGSATGGPLCVADRTLTLRPLTGTLEPGS